MPRRFFSAIIFIFICFINFSLLSRISFAQSSNSKSIQIGTFTVTPFLTDTPTPSPSSAPTIFIFPTSYYSPTPPYTFNTPTPITRIMRHLSQRDPRWRLYNPNTIGQLGRCGCGETSIGMILSYYFDTSGRPDTGSYSPPRMWDRYEQLYPSRCGTALDWHMSMLPRYGLTSAYHAYDWTNPSGANFVLRNYISAGYQIMIYYRRIGAAFGHYVLLSRVESNNLYIFDPYLLPGSFQPSLIDNNVRILSYLTIK